MLSLMGLYVATYLNYQDINKPIKPLTTVIEGKEINRKDVQVEKYIMKPFKEDEEWIDIIATAYCNCKLCTYGTGITASGTRPRLGTIACPSDISFNAKFFIPDLQYIKKDGIFTNEDVGGAIKRINKNVIKMDIWLPTHNQTEEFGIKHFKVKIIK